MKKVLPYLLFALFTNAQLLAQHTFTIVAVDPETGEIGSAGATCLDIDDLAGEEGAYVVSDIILGTGAINTQAFFTFNIQSQARDRMEAGDSPEEIIQWFMANDVSVEDRQFGIVDLIGGSGGTPRVAAFTGDDNFAFAGDIVGPNYAIQGNILMSQDVLDDMETGFLETEGTLADKLMAAMQGAKRIGAQTTCASNETSSKSAYLRVAKVEDLFSNYGHLTIDLNVSRTSFGVDPIDVLQDTYDFYLENPGTSCTNTVSTYPYTESFENDLGLWVQNDMDLSHIGNTDFDWLFNSGTTPTNNTGPSAATEGDFYLFVEASGANVGFPTKRAVLNSPCFDLSSIPESPTLKFDYHMFGTNMGDLAVRVNDGTGWTTIWLLDGNQGNQWNEAMVSLEAYAGQTIQLRMDSNTGYGERSDAAFDNVRISSEPLSVDDIALSSISVFPNPARDVLKIVSPSTPITQIVIYDLQGRVVSQINSTLTYQELNVSDLKSALYLVEVVTNSGKVTERFVKK